MRPKVKEAATRALLKRVHACVFKPPRVMRVALVGVPGLVATTVGVAVASPLLFASSLVSTPILGPLKLARLPFSPFGGSVRPNHAKQQRDKLQGLKRDLRSRSVACDATLITIPSKKSINGHIHACWIECTTRTKKACILVGGNSEVWCDMLEEAKFHLEHGINVLVVTYSGYPDPSEAYDGGRTVAKLKYTPSEESMLADAEAALDWLKRQSFAESDVLVEGHSLGSLAAHLLGASRPNLGAVVAVQPLLSIERVSTYAATNFLSDALERLGGVPRMVSVTMLYAPFRIAGMAVARMAYDGNRLDMTTAIKHIRAPYCVFGADDDELMSIIIPGPNKSGPGRANFAATLIKEAKQNLGKRARLIRQCRAWHGRSYAERSSEKKQYASFLKSAGFLL